MASAVFGAIGFIANIPKLIAMFEDAYPPADTNGASVRIKIGNPGDNNPGTEGEVSAVYGWDTFNNYLGKADGGKIEAAGDIGDYIIQTEAAGSRADYVGVAAGNDAICIAWITVTMKDGTPGGAWTGDIGAECEQETHWNGEPAGKIKKDDGTEENYLPRCTWLDKDNTGGNNRASMKFKVDAYGKDVVSTIDNQDQCKYTMWGDQSAPINGAPGDDATVNPESKKRSIRERYPEVASTLIISSNPMHTARELCERKNSAGYDVIGSDGWFCNPDTKELVPLCRTENVPGCFNDDDIEGSRRLTRRTIGLKRGLDSHKQYTRVNHYR